MTNVLVTSSALLEINKLTDGNELCCAGEIIEGNVVPNEVRLT